MTNKPSFYLTDVFGTRRYSGNQLATFVNCGSLSAAEMQQIARELNFSETTFIPSSEPDDGAFEVRIFTPKAEVEFAGHPTLGTAHILREKVIRSPVTQVILKLKAGRVPVSFSTERDGTEIAWMRQFPPQFGATPDAAALTMALGIAPDDMDTRWPAMEVSTGFPHLIVPLKSLGALRRISIRRDACQTLIRNAWAKIILAFAPEPYESGQTLSVRVFADHFGIPEDAATGSGNGALAAYLAQQRYLGASTFAIATGQGYEIGRPSTLFLRATGTDGQINVSVGGQVAEVAQGVWG
jgi:trans-2,3-dihydro-3-hydroxyanthranilate isomerase